MSSIHHIKEDLLHYVWKMKLFDMEALYSTDGRAIEILNFGYHNGNSGPDFSNAKIRIGDTIWAGNIEMHVNSSDWDKHKHENDPAYDNVILHVIYLYDRDIKTKKGTILPSLVLKGRISEPILTKYELLMSETAWIPCAKVISNEVWEDFHIWQYKILTDRIQRKTEIYEKHLISNNYDWDATFYWGLCRYFGAKINIIPFEMLAQSLPIHIIYKNQKSLSTIEALLYGQAGFMNDKIDDEYFLSLQKEYLYLSKKYKLSSLDKVVWKFSKLRPASFPTVRIAQLAAILNKESRLFSYILSNVKLKEIFELFEIFPSNYWEEHYRFGESSVKVKKPLSKAFTEIIMINVAVPLIFLYGKHTGNEDIADSVFETLEKLSPEKNAIISKWKTFNAKPKNASDTQALLELKTRFCNNQRCLSCPIGNKIMK